MSKVTFRGSMPAPKHEHGDTLSYGNLQGVVQYRRHNGRGWEYGLLVPGYVMVFWINE